MSSTIQNTTSMMKQMKKMNKMWGALCPSHNIMYCSCSWYTFHLQWWWNNIFDTKFFDYHFTEITMFEFLENVTLSTCQRKFKLFTTSNVCVSCNFPSLGINYNSMNLRTLFFVFSPYRYRINVLTYAIFYGWNWKVSNRECAFIYYSDYKINSEMRYIKWNGSLRW